MSEQWKKHDSYPIGVSTGRIVTRSQTGFVRVEKTPSNMELFANEALQEIRDAPHLMSLMAGEFGSVPRTVITKSTATHLDNTKELNDALKTFKDHQKESAKGNTSKRTDRRETDEKKHVPVRKDRSLSKERDGKVSGRKARAPRSKDKQAFAETCIVKTEKGISFSKEIDRRSSKEREERMSEHQESASLPKSKRVSGENDRGSVPRSSRSSRKKVSVVFVKSQGISEETE